MTKRKRNNKGWYNDPDRHALASKGVETTKGNNGTDPEKLIEISKEAESQVRSEFEIDFEGKEYNEYHKSIDIDFVEDDGDQFHFFAGDQQFWVKKKLCKVQFGLEDLPNRAFIPKWFDIKFYNIHHNKIKEKIEEREEKIRRRKNEIERKFYKEI